MSLYFPMGESIIDPVVISAPNVPTVTPAAPPPAPKPKATGGSWWETFVQGVASGVAGKYLTPSTGGSPYMVVQQSSIIPGVPNWLVLGGAVVGVYVLLKRR